jgi:tripartite ATP-independent transporter DctP family solute receptor
VSQRTNGEVEVQIFANAQLGGERDVAEGMQLGTVQGSPITLAVLSNWVPEGQVFDLPFVFRDETHAANVYMGPIGDALAEKHTSKGFRVLGFWLNGSRHPMGRFPINAPTDVKGKKMRVIQSPLHVGLWQTLGAIPTPMAAPEIYNALQTGVIDFFDNSKGSYWSFKFFEVAPYFTDLGHIYAIGAFTLSEKFWQQLPADHQKVVRETAREVIPYQDDLLLKAEIESMKNAVERGTIVTTPDKKPWQDAMEPVWAEWAPKVGGMDAIRAIVDHK